jgi:hypothetical protein
MKVIDLPDGNRVEFPDEAGEDLILSTLRNDFPQHFKSPERQRLEGERAAIPSDTGWMGGAVSNLGDVAGDVARGASQVPIGALRTVGRVNEGFNRAVGGDPAARSMFTDAGDWAERQVGKLPGGDPEALPTQFNQAVGQMGSMLGGGLAAKAMGVATPVAAAAAAGSGFGAEFDDTFQRSRDQGDDPDTALLKSLSYATGATAIEGWAGAGRVFRKLFPSAKVAAQKLGAWGVSKEVAGNFLAGYGEEASQRVLQNLIVDPSGDPLEGANREGLVGSLVQGPVTTMGLRDRKAAPVKRNARAPKSPPVEVPPLGSIQNPIPAAQPMEPLVDAAAPAATPPAATGTVLHMQGPAGEAIEVQVGPGDSVDVAKEAMFRLHPGAELVSIDTPAEIPPPESGGNTPPQIRWSDEYYNGLYDQPGVENETSPVDSYLMGIQPQAEPRPVKPDQPAPEEVPGQPTFEDSLRAGIQPQQPAPQAQPPRPEVTFEQFKREYQDAFKRMMSYKPTEVGSQVWAEHMAKMSDAYPEWAAQVEGESGELMPEPPQPQPTPPAPDTRPTVDEGLDAMAKGLR